MAGAANRRSIILGLALSLVSISASAQQPYRAPRTPDGQPDLRGIWQALNTAVWNIEDHAAELGIPAGHPIDTAG